MPSTPRAHGRRISRVWGSAADFRVAALASLLALGLLGLIATQASADPGNGNACPPSSHNPGGDPPCGFPPDSEPPPETSPPPAAPSDPVTPTSQVAGVVHKEHAKTTTPAPHSDVVVVPPRANPKAPVAVKHSASSAPAS